jgi:hypothetical protein
MMMRTTGFTAVMAQRREPPNALDYFPTPPWATRALFQHVLPALDVEAIGRVWEPACGEGHMAAVIAEFTTAPVIASDIFPYGYGTAPHDFLHDVPLTAAEWIISNPPFSIACEFTLRALELAAEGVAMLVRTQWIEGVGRYKALFHDRPPTVYAPFVERVPMVKGRWDPDASTATSYAWFVWCERNAGVPPRIFWIRPGCRAALTHTHDRQRFAAWTLAAAEAPLFSPRPLGINDDTLSDTDTAPNPSEPAEIGRERAFHVGVNFTSGSETG